MGIKFILVLAGAVLVGAAVLVTLSRDSMPGGRLGPADGHDLPAIELDRVAVGSQAPDFSLRALGGEVVTLSGFRGRKNVVLVFYRGHW